MSLPLFWQRRSLWSRAAITLHNSYIDFNNPQSVSTARCVNASRRILAAYYSLSATSLDIGRLHPSVVVGANRILELCQESLSLFPRFAGI